jgi:hypothetical protein
MRLETPIRSDSSIQTGTTEQDQNVLKAGSPGGSPSQKSSSMRTVSGKRRNSEIRKHVSPQRASPIPNPPPLLASITNRRRLEEYTLGQIFEPKLGSATLDFAMIPKPTTFA